MLNWQESDNFSNSNRKRVIGRSRIIFLNSIFLNVSRENSLLAERYYDRNGEESDGTSEGSDRNGVEGD